MRDRLLSSPSLRDRIDGAWRSDADYHMIHRVAAVRGRGVARTIFSFAAEHSDYLRCDTHEENTPMRRALNSFGFRECGTITVANGTERVAYDWLKDGSTGAAANQFHLLDHTELPNNLSRNS